MSHETFNVLNNHEYLLEIIDMEYLQLYFFQGDVLETEDKIKSLFEIDDDKDLEMFKAAHFILSSEVSSFIGYLPSLLRNLSHSTYRKDEEMRGRIRGNINWNQTIKTRLSLGYNDKTLFVCSPPNKNYNLEENQLIKFLLKKIIFLKEHYLPFANPSNYEFDFERIDEDKDWYTKVRNCYEVSRRTLKKVYFDDIDDINKISNKHIKKTANHKNFLYSKVVFDVYRLYKKLFFEKDNKDILEELINQRIITSRDSNKLFELYVLIELVKNITINLHGEPEYNLLYDKKGKKENIFKVSNEKDSILIYYQKTPEDLYKNSMYLELCEGYSIGHSVRAPDIILKYENSKKYRLIEIKNTNNPNYIRDSIYKVMGYLKDFEENSFLTEEYPVILVTFGGINQKNVNWQEDIVICNKDEFMDSLKDGVFDD